MRLKNLIIGDIKFQIKYGFYFVYMVFTLLYLGVLLFIPKQWKEVTVAILIFSDPAAMGLFFMGAIVLLEKSQRVLESIAVSPIQVWEYIMSKLVSLGIISSIVAVILNGRMKNLFYILIITFFGSMLFALCGLIVACKIQNLNQFMMATIPFEVVLFIPAMLYLFGVGGYSPLYLIHPGCALLGMLSGRAIPLAACVSMVFWTVVAFYITHKLVTDMMQSVEGVKL